MSFRQALTIVSEDHRQVGVFWTLGAQGFENINLSGCIINMIVSPDNMGNFHFHVVDNDSEVVGRGTIRASDDQVIELAIFDAHRAFNMIRKNHLALLGVFESNDKFRLFIGS